MEEVKKEQKVQEVQFETGCCPRFKTEPWDEKEVVFQERLFVKDNVRQFFGIPFGFQKIVMKNMPIILEAGAIDDRPFILYRALSPWKAEVYIGVTKDVPDAKVEKISAKFVTKVFEGPFTKNGKFSKEMIKYVRSKGKEPKSLYMHFTTCPKCAKAYGHNYTVILAEVK